MRARLGDWRFVLLAGVVVAVALASVGFWIQREAFGVVDPEALPYVHQRPTPFEREVHLESDHSVVLADGDEDLWYFGAAVVAALTFAGLPLLRARARAPRDG